MKKKHIYISLFILSLLIVVFVFLAQCCSYTDSLLIDASYAKGTAQLDFASSQSSQLKTQILYIDENKNLTTLNFDENSSVNPFYIRVHKNELTPLVIIFSDEKNLCDHYTGIFYPVCKEFSVHAGFCAYIYLQLLLNSNQKSEDIVEYCNHFNWQRFYEKVLTYENPFLLDSQRLCQDIARHNFSERSFKIKSL